MNNRFLIWLRNSGNLKVAIFATGLIVSLITGIWQLWLHRKKEGMERPTLTVTVEKGDFFSDAKYVEHVMSGLCPEGERCSDMIYEMSLLDIGINNPSERDLMITEVTLIPEWIRGERYAGETVPSKKYAVNLNKWCYFCYYLQSGLSDSEAAEIYPGFNRERFVRGGE